MLINGEKYACEACVRGHRVSSCSHSERKLLHVNKKGRPVSQCPHCRSLRKSRSQHVKCECHDKSHAKEDCPHLKDLQLDGQAGCCCGHGAKCTCALKKEAYLESVPEDIGSILHSQKEKHKFVGPNVNNHDTKPTIFMNGHHKPVHKFNDAHNHCGAPYRIPSRSNSHREIAQRSSDSLPLTNRQHVHHESPLHNVLSASQSRQARSEHNSPLLAPTSNPTASFQVEIPPLSPNAYSYSPFDAQSPGIQPAPHFPENIPESWFTTHDDAHSYGPPAVPELAYIDWSKYGFGTPQMDSPANMKNVYAGLANNQLPQFAMSMEHLQQLGTPSGFNTPSGDVSEVDELPVFRPNTMRSTSHASNDQSSTGATEDDQSHRLSSASSYFGTPAGNALASNLEDLDIDKFISEHSQRNRQQQQQQQHIAVQPSQPILPDQHQKHFQPQQLTQQPTPPQSHHTVSTPPESIRGYSITSNPSPPETTEPTMPYSIQEAQAHAHEGLNRDRAQAQKEGTRTISNAETFEDPMWFQPDVDFYGNPRTFNLDDEREDEQWAR